MRRLPLLAALLACLVPVASPAAPLRSGAAHARSFRAGELVVGWFGAADVVPTRGPARGAPPALARALERHGLHAGRALGAATATGFRCAVLTSDRPGFDPHAAAAELRAAGTLRVACPNYLLAPFITIPNDPYVLPEQWYIQSTADADVDVPEAWDIARGDTSVVIGIADTGVDLGHPDLVNKIWINRGEIADNGIDDDANGYVDDVHGWDFGDDDADPNPEPLLDPELGIDIAFHGTFVAGIAAAGTNEGVGMAGAGWYCRVMPLKLADAEGHTTTAALAGAVLYAANAHAGVLNMSLGAPGEPGLPEFMQQLVDEATAAGTACVAAAGNDADSTRTYPAACDGVIAVGASDGSNLRASFSNWGPWIDVAAPGTHMLSAIHRNYTVDDFSQIFYLYLFGWDGVNPYMYGDGTSFATPLVAGVCGLVLARWPMPPAALLAQLLATGDALPYDLPIGVKVNAARAVATPLAVPRTPTTRAAALAAAPNPFRDRVTLSAAPGRDGAVFRIVDLQGRTVRVLAARLRRVEWDGRDDAGMATPPGVYLVRLDGVPQATQRIARVR